jgi:K+ transporter
MEFILSRDTIGSYRPQKRWVRRVSKVFDAVMFVWFVIALAGIPFVAGAIAMLKFISWANYLPV